MLIRITKRNVDKYFSILISFVQKMDQHIQKLYMKYPIKHENSFEKFQDTAITKSEFYNNLYFVFQEDNDIIGYTKIAPVNFFFLTKQPTISDFYIDKKFRNKGYGKKYLKQILKIKKNIWHLSVLTNNVSAIKLYKSIGFKIHSISLVPKSNHKKFKKVDINHKLTVEKINTLKKQRTNFFISYYKKLKLPYQQLTKLYLFNHKKYFSDSINMYVPNFQKKISLIYYDKNDSSIIKDFLFTLSTNNILFPTKVPLSDKLINYSKEIMIPTTYFMFYK